MSHNGNMAPLFTPRTEIMPVGHSLTPDEKACPFCAETIKAAAIKCRHCGETFGTPTGALGQAPQVVVNNVINNSVLGSYQKPLRSRTTAALLALFFGGIGIHKFYVGRSGAGVIYFLMSWTLIPMLIGIVEAISYLSYRSDEEFTHRACS